MENGDFWSTDMNSFNHYAYGSVADWIYEKAAGIQALESEPGYRKVIIAPLPDKRLGWLRVRLDTRNGKIVSCWRCEKDSVRYEISVDMPAVIIIDGRPVKVNSGKYIFWGKSAEYTDERKTEK
jgi:alpha-L-rhamnosidase